MAFGIQWHAWLWNRNTYRRYIGRNQWLMPFIGFDWRYRKFGINEIEKTYLDNPTLRIIAQ
jgi:hypothetical protein